MRLRKSFANVVQRRRQPNANLVWVGIAAWGIAEAISLLLSVHMAQYCGATSGDLMPKEFVRHCRTNRL